MAYISKHLRQFVAERALARCEYCMTQQGIVVSMSIDHILPESLGGETIERNLCFSCVNCNTSKGASISWHDSKLDRDIPLFNPRHQNWLAHFEWSEDGTEVVPKTDVGRATIACLNMNRDILLTARKRWVKAGWHPPK